MLTIEEIISYMIIYIGCYTAYFLIAICYARFKNLDLILSKVFQFFLLAPIAPPVFITLPLALHNLFYTSFSFGSIFLTLYALLLGVGTMYFLKKFMKHLKQARDELL